jgi:TolB protein
MRARFICCAVATSATALVASLTASASFPGANGTIVFQSNRAGGSTAELYLQNEDGTGVRRLTFNNAVDRMPRFSPDGTKIAFASNRDGNVEIYVMELASGATHRVTNDPGWDDQPVFTADGRHLVWQKTQNAPFACPCSIWTAALDGSGARQVHTGLGNAMFPDMSPHGQTLTFTSDRSGISAIYTQKLSGNARRQVTSPPAGFGDFRSRWSPKANDLVFLRDDGTNFNDIYTVHQDGTELIQLTAGARFEGQAQFSPDGEKVLFSVFANDGGARMHTIRRDGTGEHALPQLAAIDETFDGPELDAAMWWTFLSGTGGTLAQTAGHVELTLATDAANGPSGFMGPSFGTQCRATGDYDARVSFALLDWPASNGTHLNLGDAGATGSIGRRSEAGIEDYLSFFNPVPTSAPTSDQSGRLRLVRTGSTLTSYYASGSGWLQLLSGPTTTAPALLNAHLFSNDAFFGDQFVRVALDDFQVTASGFECPSWWRDSGADWQPVD